MKEVSALNKYIHALITVLLISSTAGLHYMSQEEVQRPQANESLPTFEGIQINQENKTVDLESMTLRQKTAFTVVSFNYEKEINKNKIVGGMHLRSAGSKREFKERIENNTEGRPIPPLISADLEGCIEPTSSFRDFKSFKQVNNSQQAYEIGKTQGEFLSDIGVDINFSPVVDLNDSIWGCRTFEGNYSEVSEKACSYIKGLDEKGIKSTAKHYPGKTLTGKDPHEEMKHVEIREKDLAAFHSAMNCSVDAVMPSHQISTGKIDTQGAPADVSNVTRNHIRENGFEGLIVSDAISMGGITHYYKKDRNRYIDLFQTNDLILNLVGGVNDTARMITTIEKAVENGNLEQRFVDDSARRVLNARGWNVKVREGNETKIYEAY